MTCRSETACSPKSRGPKFFDEEFWATAWRRSRFGAWTCNFSISPQNAAPMPNAATPLAVTARVRVAAKRCSGTANARVSAPISGKSNTSATSASTTAGQPRRRQAVLQSDLVGRGPPKAPAQASPTTQRRSRSGWTSGPEQIAAVMAAVQVVCAPKMAVTAEINPRHGQGADHRRLIPRSAQGNIAGRFCEARVRRYKGTPRPRNTDRRNAGTTGYGSRADRESPPGSVPKLTASAGLTSRIAGKTTTIGRTTMGNPCAAHAAFRQRDPSQLPRCSAIREARNHGPQRPDPAGRRDQRRPARRPGQNHRHLRPRRQKRRAEGLAQ